MPVVKNVLIASSSVDGLTQGAWLIAHAAKPIHVSIEVVGRARETSRMSNGPVFVELAAPIESAAINSVPGRFERSGFFRNTDLTLRKGELLEWAWEAPADANPGAVMRQTSIELAKPT